MWSRSSWTHAVRGTRWPPVILAGALAGCVVPEGDPGEPTPDAQLATEPTPMVEDDPRGCGCEDDEPDGMIPLALVVVPVLRRRQRSMPAVHPA